MKKQALAFAICCSFATAALSPLAPSTATAAGKTLSTNPIGVTVGAPTVVGNTIQIPVHIPVNLCGNTVNIVGLLNPTSGNTCVSV